MSPLHMILLGYEISVQDLAEFVCSIPDRPRKLPEDPSRGLITYMSVYDNWRRTRFEPEDLPELDSK